MYWDPEPSLGAPAIPAPGTEPDQLVPSAEVSVKCWTIGWPDVGSSVMSAANT
jgi:hypothetical protein